MRATLRPPHAAFVDSCKHHCGEWGAIAIDGLTSPQAVEAFYKMGAESLPNSGWVFQNATYPCASCCSTAAMAAGAGRQGPATHKLKGVGV